MPARHTLTLACSAALAATGAALAATAAPDPAVLSLGVSGPARTLGGASVAYRVQVRNTGPVTTARDVEVSVPVPADAFLAERPRNSRVSGRTVLVQLGRLAPGTSKFAVIGLRWEANASGRHCVEGIARADNARRVSTAQTCTNVVAQAPADPRSVPTVRVGGPERLTAGQVGAFTVTVVNRSNAAAENAGAGMVLAPGMFVARRTAGMIVTGDSVVWSLGTIPPGGTRRLPLRLRADSEVRGLRCNLAYVGASNASRSRRNGLCTRVVAPRG